jgi:hypothetical protein
MLFHFRPRLLSPFRNVALIDLEIEALDVHLVGGVDLATRRPYPNKRYVVACRKQGQKAIDGILLEIAKNIKELCYTARWAIEAEFCATHRVDYKLLDQEFDAASDNMILWHACSGELGNWTNRIPPRAKSDIPMVTEPIMEVLGCDVDGRRARKDFIECGMIISRHQLFEMPTIERERIINTKLNDRMPPIQTVFRLG